MINRCSVCSHVVPRGEIFYAASADCQLPESIPEKHGAYAQSLLASRLKDYDKMVICIECIGRAKKYAPGTTKPVPVHRDFDIKPKK